MHIGHSPTHLDDADTFVYTTAINPKHEEFVAARASGKPVLRRAAALAAALEDRRCVAVAGTHGKTSTTSLLVGRGAGVRRRPVVRHRRQPLRDRQERAPGHRATFAVVEADESDGSFLLTRPSAAVVTNVEADHLENHGDLEGIFRAFEQFVDRVDPGGLLLTCADDAGARRIADYARAHGRRVLTYGDAPRTPTCAVTTSSPAPTPSSSPSTGPLLGAAARAGRRADRRAHGPQRHRRAGPGRRPRARRRRRRRRVGRVRRACTAASSPHGEGGGVRVYDDYAHHPTEIAASLRAAKRGAGRRPGRLIAVFQPGTYSRTQTFAREFADALAIADIAVVMDIFPAREEPIPGVTGATISDLIDAAAPTG